MLHIKIMQLLSFVSIFTQDYLFPFATYQFTNIAFIPCEEQPWINLLPSDVRWWKKKE